MAIVVEVVVVAMKAVNLQSYMPQRACLMGRPSKNGLEERMHLCTGKWVLNIGEDMRTDSARFETFNLFNKVKLGFTMSSWPQGQRLVVQQSI